MAKINKSPEDRKKEIEEAKKDQPEKKTLFGVEVKPAFQGGVEKPPIIK